MAYLLCTSFESALPRVWNYSCCPMFSKFLVALSEKCNDEKRRDRFLSISSHKKDDIKEAKSSGYLRMRADADDLMKFQKEHLFYISTYSTMGFRVLEKHFPFAWVSCNAQLKNLCDSLTILHDLEGIGFNNIEKAANGQKLTIDIIKQENESQFQSLRMTMDFSVRTWSDILSFGYYKSPCLIDCVYARILTTNDIFNDTVNAKL